MKKILFGLLLGGWLVAQAASPVPPASVGSATNTPAIKNASLDARLQKRLTLKLQNCPLRDALKHLHQVSDLNLVLLSGISEVTEINLDIKDMPAEQIARYLAEMAYLECVVEGATVVFRDKTDAKSGAKKAAKGPDDWMAERLKKDIRM